jgi:uncharacterized membrane protein YphA (DoxX/SURF4 family)
VAFGGPGLDATGQGPAMLGFHPGRRHALMAGRVETDGGLFLALGLLTPVAAAVVFERVFRSVGTRPKRRSSAAIGAIVNDAERLLVRLRVALANTTKG